MVGKSCDSVAVSYDWYVIGVFVVCLWVWGVGGGGGAVGVVYACCLCGFGWESWNAGQPLHQYHLPPPPITSPLLYVLLVMDRVRLGQRTPIPPHPPPTGTLPVGCRPLLVFLNTRSGPQLGSLLKRNFLRELNPLQVVELPADSPEHALACFAEVPNLRVLVVGGDGTVGWVLGALDVLKSTMVARGRLEWQLPPVALMPLGTGRCFYFLVFIFLFSCLCGGGGGWGGGWVGMCVVQE